MAMAVTWMVMTRWVGARESIGWWCPTGGGARQLVVPEPLPDAMACMMADSCYGSDHNALVSVMK